MIMVKAGEAVDEQIDILARRLDSGRHPHRRRQRQFPRHPPPGRRNYRPRGFDFLGVGVSGGEEGARHGPSIMAGGSRKQWPRVEEIFNAIAAKFEGEPCCAYLGPGGAGHFVKTIHNGIEYADMQMIAEVYGVMRDGLGMAPAEMAEVFDEWNKGPLNSYLIEITADVLTAVDPKTGKPLVDVILDKAGQKGTGRWSAIEAQDLGVAGDRHRGGRRGAQPFRPQGRARRRREALRRSREDRRQPRRPRRALDDPGTGAARRQDRRLRAGLRGDGRGLGGVRLGPAARHRSPRSGAPAASSARPSSTTSPRPTRRAARHQSDDGRRPSPSMLQGAPMRASAHGRRRAALKRHSGAGALLRARLFRLRPHRPLDRRSDPGTARFLRRARFRTDGRARQGRTRAVVERVAKMAKDSPGRVPPRSSQIVRLLGQEAGKLRFLVAGVATRRT